MITVDYNFGKKNEEQLLERLQNNFGRDLSPTKSKVCPVDFCSDSIVIELKTRRNNLRRYPTTMISKSKIDYMLESGKKAYVVFNFTDGIYYIEITKESIEKFSLAKGGRYDRGRPEVNIYYYIPIELLCKLDR